MVLRLRPPLFLALAALSFLVMACAPARPSLGGGPTKAQKPLPTAILTCGQVSIEAELATTDAQREAGLMFRKSLPAGKGMLFVFESDQILNFWMRNTTLPLSIAYISSDGTIRDILDLEPLSEAGISSSRSVRYALEVPRGWFSSVGIKVGDRLVLPPGN